MPRTGIVRLPDKPKEDIPEVLRKLGIPEDVIRREMRPRPQAPQRTPPEKERTPPREAALTPSPAHTVDRPAARKGREPEKPSGASSACAEPRPVASTVFALVILLASSAAYGVYFWRAKLNPRTQVLKSASRYLSSLQAGNFGSAYDLLSKESSRGCPPDEFQRLQPAPGWTLAPGSLVIEALEEKRALVRYETLRPAGAAERDLMEFVLEDGRWRRAYPWALLARAVQAMDEGDFSAASEAARKAVAGSPLDAAARAVLCEAAYGAIDSARAYAECREAVSLSRRHPPGVDGRSLLRVHQILADLEKNSLGKPDEAQREYGVLLALPGLEKGERCPLLLARADARGVSKDYPGALSDFLEASSACENPADADYARASAAAFSGRSGDEAVAAVQRHRMPDQATVKEWREASRRALMEGFTGRKARLAEIWSSSHSKGPNYKVALRGGETEILQADVDVWSHTLKVNIHVP
jgi:tetratricopeptide (TPR) repeat protein